MVLGQVKHGGLRPGFCQLQVGAVEGVHQEFVKLPPGGDGHGEHQTEYCGQSHGAGTFFTLNDPGEVKAKGGAHEAGQQVHKIVKMRQLVKQLQVGAKHNADKNNDIQQGLGQGRHFFNKRAVAEDLEQIPQMGENKAKYALKTHHRIAVDKGISGADEHSQAHQQPKGQLHLGNFGDRVFFDLIGHNCRPFL